MLQSLKVLKISYATLLLTAVLALSLASCAVTRKATDEQLNRVRVTHLTHPANTVSDSADTEVPPINNPQRSGNVITGTADMGEKPLARIENPDGYAPDSPSLFTSSSTDAVATNPTTVKAKQITVKEGDTVYSIATAHGLTPADLAATNNLDANFLINPGQVLILSKASDLPAASSNAPAKAPDVTTPAQPQATSAQAIAKLNTKQSGALAWSWPLEGRIKVLKPFRKGDANKGMDLDGKTGDAVYAAGDGTVVYSGNELKGYGNLIIISHKGDYMSAYGHNSKLLVEADQEVKRGEKIAEVGSVESNRVKLFFQIRHRGEPVNPVPLMPKPW